VAQALLLSNIIYVTSSFGSAEETAFTVLILIFMALVLITSFGAQSVATIRHNAASSQTTYEARTVAKPSNAHIRVISIKEV
jgi:hypothetical protein